MLFRSQDIENLIRYIPNTADGCCLERGFLERINLVFLNTGEAYLMMMSNPNMDSATASIDRGRGIVSAHKMKTHFCDDCIREILNIVEDEFIDEAVIYDTEKKTFYPVTEGDIQIGDYSFHTYYVDGGYEIEIAYTGE